MAVFDADWWGVWWPWMLVWLAVLACSATAIATLVGGWLANRGRESVRDVPSAPLYLDKAEVMAMYLTYGGALSQEIEQTIRRTDDANLSGELPTLKATIGGSKSEEVIRRYVEDAEPLSVIRVVREALENAHAVVRVQLTDLEVTDNRALAAAARRRDIRGGVRLHTLDTEFVLLRGKFRRVPAADGHIGFTAPYGSPASGEGPMVRFECKEDGMLLTVPSAPFKARCLCRVDEWDSAAQVLSVRPIAFYL
ncbi:hypothetical protein ACTG9Q_27760 [Actinokineospora sp. 24-640]